MVKTDTQGISSHTLTFPRFNDLQGRIGILEKALSLSIKKAEKELQETNISLSGCKKYYNDNLIDYNHLCTAFPSKIIAKIYRYKVKDFIDEIIKDELKILNEPEQK